MDLIFRSRLIQAVERVLHAPGNYKGGILEMTVVFDQAVPPRKHQSMIAEIAKMLKNHSEVFRNVRLNAVLWNGEEKPCTELVPMSVLIMGKYPQDIAESKNEAEKITIKENEQRAEITELLSYLKLFHARAKLIFLLTDGQFLIEEESACEAMKPFLERKLIVITTSARPSTNIFRHILEFPKETEEEKGV